MIDPNAEINRLRDLMPASGRMKTRILINDAQPHLIQADFPRPWKQTHPISLNLRLWDQLSQQERDMLFLRTVCWSTTVSLLKPSWYQALGAVGLVSGGVELFQADAVGVLVAGGLTALAAVQIWRNTQGVRTEVAADEKAVQVAQRRGYSQKDAARALLSAIEAVPRVEGYPALSVTDLIRCQNLRSLLGTTKAPVPESFLEQ